MNAKTIIIVILCSFPLFSQFNGRRFSAAVNAVFTTSAKVYLNPNSSDEILRNRSYPMENILNPSLDIRYLFTESMVLGFSTEYMESKTGNVRTVVFSGSTTVEVPVTDGFRLIPLELSLYYILPFSTERFKFMMGGGGGYYYGQHIRNIGSASAETVQRKTAVGIHVSVSMDYMIRPNISVRGEMKFRDPQFTLKNRYSQQEAVLNGRSIRIPQESFDSKINVDGVTFLLGGVFHF